MRSYKEKLHHSVNSLEEFTLHHFPFREYIQLPDGKWKPEKPSGNEPGCLGFSEEDVAHLATHFSTKQLRNELKTAEIEQGIARVWAKDDDVVYWREFGKVCRRALDSQRAKQPKATNGKFSIGAVREAQNIVDVIERYTNLHKAGRDFKGSCPFHDDRQPSLSVSEEKQRFHCFSCEQRGDVIQFIMQMENLDLNGACRFLAGK